MPRPTKLTPDMQEEIVRRLRAGATIKATCDSVGIGTTTYYLWHEIGNAHLDKQPHDRMPRKVADREIYVAFVDATTRAQADGLIQAAIAFRTGMNPSQQVSNTTETVTETKLRTVKHKDGTVEQVPYEQTKTINKRTTADMPGDWRAAMEYLARRDPDNWARQKISHEHTGKDGEDLKIIFKTGMDMNEL